MRCSFCRRPFARRDLFEMADGRWRCFRCICAVIRKAQRLEADATIEHLLRFLTEPPVEGVYMTIDRVVSRLRGRTMADEPRFGIRRVA